MYCTIRPIPVTTNKLGIFRFCNQYNTVLCITPHCSDGFQLWLVCATRAKELLTNKLLLYHNDCNGGGYVLNISNAAAILVQKET